MNRSRQHQQGAIMMIMVVIIMVIGLTFLVSKTSALLASIGRQFSATYNSQNQIQKALISFTATYQRLPCPAKPLNQANPGWPDDVKPLSSPAAGHVCLYPTGVVPWNALGLTQEQVTDEWGRLISYRVFDGTVGLTQNNGASALDCDTDNLTTPNSPITSFGLCNPDHNTLAATFISGKGFQVNDFGTNVPNVAFVLISHGPSGLGGYLPNATQSTMPTAGALDYPNTQANPTYFVSQSASATDIAPGTTGHYDDVVTYLSITDLLKLATQSARDWPEASMPNFNGATTLANMTSPSTDPAKPHFMTSGTSGQGFTQDLSDSNAVQAGIGSGSYSSCLWWPLKLNLVGTTTRNFIAASIEFAAVDNPSDSFPGFTLGFLSGSGSAPTNSTCGTTTSATTTATFTADPVFISVASTTGISLGMNVYGTGIDVYSKVFNIDTVGSTVEIDRPTTGLPGTTSTVSFADSRRIRRDLGWADNTPASGTLASYNPNRFAVEFDAYTDIGFGGPPVVPSANDPSIISPQQPHLAVDFDGVTHGLDASSCAATASGLGCDSQILPFPTVAKTATGTAGQSTITITDPSGIAGVVHGMPISGINTGAGAYVTAISGNIVTLSAPNIANVSETITFNSISTSDFMQNGLSVFHTARVEVSPRDCVAPTGTTGVSGATTINVLDNSGIAHGMSVHGIGIASGSTVEGVSGTTVSLSLANSSDVSGTVVFGDNSTVSTSATGAVGMSTITVTNPDGISVGMTVSGTGIDPSATVQSYSGTTVTLSAVNSGLVSGNVTFTSVPALTRTLVKTWTLSNAGCNENPTPLCTALKNTGSKFPSNINISTNRQVMHAVSCIPSPSVANAYDSLYFGITTANRNNNSATTTNVIFRGLSMQTPLLP